MRRHTFKTILQDRSSCHSTKKKTGEKEKEKEEGEKKKKKKKNENKRINRNREKKTNSGFSMERNQWEATGASIGSNCAIKFIGRCKKNDILTASVCFIRSHHTLRIHYNPLGGPEFDGHPEAVDRVAVVIFAIPHDRGSDGRVDAADGEPHCVAVAAGDCNHLGIARGRRNRPR